MNSIPKNHASEHKFKLSQMRELNLIIILAVAIVIMSFASPYFPHWANIKTVLGSMSIDGIIVVGMTIILISGGIDLSVGAVMCLSMAICAKLFIAGLNPWVAAIVAMAACAGIGAGIGFLVTKVKLTHFIVTLAVMGIARGVVEALTTGTPISIVNIHDQVPSFKFLGQGQFGEGDIQIPMTIIVFAVIVVIMEIIVRKSSIMRLVFYTGSNEKAAAYSGIKVNKVKTMACVACSMFAGFAGIIYLNKFSGVALSAGVGMEMTAIASAVIGGVSMNGGKGSVLGAILGLALMSIVQDALTLFTVAAFWQNLIRYIIVLAAVILDSLQQNAALKRVS